MRIIRITLLYSYHSYVVRGFASHMLKTNQIIDTIKKAGLSEKAAKIYLAALELGEATVQQLARKATVKRTSIYYILEELRDFGALIETKRDKKTYYVPETPKNVLRITKSRVADLEEIIDELEDKKNSVFLKPRIYFLYGASGFKRAWDMILGTKEEYCILTQGENFLDFVKEKYILDEIIKKKKELNIRSRQIIQDSSYARKVIAKDSLENRQSKILSPIHKLPFTTVISKNFVVFISPKIYNTCMIIENDMFAQTQRSFFETVWNSLQS